MPVMLVPTSSATVAIETFMTELSKVIRNWLDANTVRTSPEPACVVEPATCPSPIVRVYPVFRSSKQTGQCCSRVS